MIVKTLYRKILKTAKSKYNWKTTHLPIIKTPNCALKTDHHYCTWKDEDTNTTINAVTTNISGCADQDNLTALLTSVKNVCLFGENRFDNIIKLKMLAELFEKKSIYVDNKKQRGFIKL